MCKSTFIFIFFFCFINVFGQKTEYRVSLNSGLFSFSGQSAENTSFIDYSNSTNLAYTNNPYGSRKAICYGLSANVQRILKRNFIVGLDLGYEVLRSKVLVNGIEGYAEASLAKGNIFLNSNFLNTFPFVGFRFSISEITLDIVGGLDFAYCLKAYENGSVTAGDGKVFDININRKTIETEFRPRIQCSATYKKFGIYFGYSYGLANYKSTYLNGVNECYARLTRFGVTYLI